MHTSDKREQERNEDIVAQHVQESGDSTVRNSDGNRFATGPLEAMRDTNQQTVGQKDLERFFAKEGVDPLTMAFRGKIAVHPGVGGKPVDKDGQAAVMDELSHKARTENSVAYIHVPFCETHCLYCGFYRTPYRKEQSAVYVDALIRELTFWEGRACQEQGPVHAVYLGGGTPTALEPKDLGRLLEALRHYLPVANDCEITVEGRVSNLTKERIEACLDAGANRFSLGVQSFNTQVRQSVKRRSSREELIEKIGLLQSYGQAAVVVDLIYGLPFQTMDVWLDDIRTAHSLMLDGADCYQLNVYSTSPLAKAIEQGRLPAGADIMAQAKLFEAGVKTMQEAFYRRLSMSHWGRTPRERNIYNQYVKSTADCLAFGPGGGGTLHGHFYFNEPDYKQWLDLVAEGKKPVSMITYPKANARLFRCISEHMEQLRLDVQALEEAYEIGLKSLLSPVLDQWERAGLVERYAGGIVLTTAGQFWQVTLTQLLLNYLKEHLQES